MMLAAASCRKPAITSDIAESGLRANTTYHCDTVFHDHPLRMFTHDGEVGDATVIGQYLSAHPFLAGSAGTLGERHPYSVFATQTKTVLYNGLVPYITTTNNGVLDMQQQDTSMAGHGNPQGSIDLLYGYEQSYEAMRDAVLDMNGSYTKLERVDDGNYRYFESFHIKGHYNNDSVVMPYTFVASRVMQRSYPFALKASFDPQVPIGDTLLLQQGQVSFRFN